MTLTPKQQKDLDTILWFMPMACKGDEWTVTDEDIEQFFAYSERGVRRGDEDSLQAKDGYHALLQGKRWRGIHVHEMYEPGVLEGSVPYYVLLGGVDKEPMPRSVVEFLQREMFKGRDSALIGSVYEDIVQECKTNPAPI